jgi:predicted transcriptional regulator
MATGLEEQRDQKRYLAMKMASKNRRLMKTKTQLERIAEGEESSNHSIITESVESSILNQQEKQLKLDETVEEEEMVKVQPVMKNNQKVTLQSKVVDAFEEQTLYS